MSDYIKKFEFEKEPKKITYIEGEPLKLNKDFVFFHNKSFFRKELTRLQYLFKSYTSVSLLASGIRDSYLKEEYSDKYLILLFTTNDVIKETNEIIKIHSEIRIEIGCFFLITTSKYMLLLTKNNGSLVFGIDTIEDILKQVMEDYLNKRNFDEYIKIRSFKLLDCSTSS